MKYCGGNALLALREKPILWLRSISNNAIIVNFNPANMIIYANSILSHGTFRLGVLRNFPSCCTCKRGDLKCVLKVYQSQLLLTSKIGRENIITFSAHLFDKTSSVLKRMGSLCHSQMYSKCVCVCPNNCPLGAFDKCWVNIPIKAGREGTKHNLSAVCLFEVSPFLPYHPDPKLRTKPLHI